MAVAHVHAIKDICFRVVDLSDGMKLYTIAQGGERQAIPYADDEAYFQREPQVSVATRLARFLSTAQTLVVHYLRALPRALTGGAARRPGLAGPNTLLCASVGPMTACTAYGAPFVDIKCFSKEEYTETRNRLTLSDYISPSTFHAVVSVEWASVSQLLVGVMDAVIVLAVSVQSRERTCFVKVTDAQIIHLRDGARYPYLKRASGLFDGIANARVTYVPTFLRASSCGKFAAVGSAHSGTVLVLHLARSAVLHRFRVAGACTALALSSRGFLLAVGTSLRRLVLYDLLSDRLTDFAHVTGLVTREALEAGRARRSNPFRIASPVSALAFCKYTTEYINNLAPQAFAYSDERPGDPARGADQTPGRGKAFSAHTYVGQTTPTRFLLERPGLGGLASPLGRGSVAVTAAGERLFVSNVNSGLSELLAVSLSDQTVVHIFSVSCNACSPADALIQAKHLRALHVSPSRIQPNTDRGLFTCGGAVRDLSWCDDVLAIACVARESTDSSSDINGAGTISILSLSTKTDYMQDVHVLTTDILCARGEAINGRQCCVSAGFKVVSGIADRFYVQG